MDRIIIAGLLMFSVVGCASLTGPRGAPSCDGYSRRPLNRSMWDWEAAKPRASVSATPALPSVEPATPAVEPAGPLIRKGDAGDAVSSPRGQAQARTFDVAA